MHEPNQKDKLISKQEAMCLSGGLKLFLCSETIETISMSESKTIDSSEKIEGKKYLTDYSRREQKEHDLIFHEWISEEKRKKSGSERLVIPHFCRSKHMVSVASHRRVREMQAKDLQTMVWEL